LIKRKGITEEKREKNKGWHLGIKEWIQPLLIFNPNNDMGILSTYVVFCLLGIFDQSKANPTIFYDKRVILQRGIYETTNFSNVL